VKPEVALRAAIETEPVKGDLKGAIEQYKKIGGVFGRQGRRNAPALVNRGYGRAFFRDGRIRAGRDTLVTRP